MRKKKMILFGLLTVIGASFILGVKYMFSNQNKNLQKMHFVNQLANSYYALSNMNQEVLDEPGLSNPWNVGVNEDDLYHEEKYTVPDDIAHTINAASYGVNGTDQLDDTLAMIDIIDEVRKYQGEPTHIILPSGDLDFIEGMNYVNRDYGLDFSNLKNVYITGDNTNLYFHGEIKGVLLKNSENVLISGVNIDYGRPPFSVGRIIENDGQTFKVKVNEGYPVDEHTQIKAFLEYDKNAFIPRVKGNDIYGDVSQVNYLGGQTLQIKFNSKYSIAPKDTLVVLRHYIYEYDTFMIENSKNIHFENINIYSAPGMGVRAYSSENLYFNRFNTLLKPNTDRLMTVTADSLHFIDCTGDIIVTNSIYENSGDDALNVHSMYLEINKIERNNNVIFAANPRGYNFSPDIGDTLEINDEHDLTLLQSVTVTDVETVENGFKITVAETLNQSIDLKNVVGNATRTAKLEFKNNLVRNKRCRGILIQTRYALVENNTFANLSDAGILVTADSNNWYESITSSNVTIRNNKFLKNNYGQGGSQGDITIQSFGENYNLAAIGVQKHFTIENNFIANSANAGIAINSVEDIILKNNLIFNVGVLPKTSLYNSGIFISNSKDIKLDKNDVMNNSSNKFKSINIGPSVNIDTIQLTHNLGFSERDLTGEIVNILTEVDKSNNPTISIYDNSLDDWNQIGTDLEIKGITDVDQNQLDFNDSDFKVNHLKMTYDDTGIYFSYDITDDELVWISGQYWNGDGVELFMTTETESQDPTNVVKLTNSSCLQLFMGPALTGGNQVIDVRTSEAIIEHKKDIKMNFYLKPDGSGYIGEGFIPFTVIPDVKNAIDAGDEISFVLNFSDADSTGVRVQYATTTHPVEYNKFVPLRMSKVKFVEEEE